jgi:hypothetical protein
MRDPVRLPVGAEGAHLLDQRGRCIERLAGLDGLDEDRGQILFAHGGAEELVREDENLGVCCVQLREHLGEDAALDQHVVAAGRAGNREQVRRCGHG